MKKVLLLLLVFTFSFSVNAQIETPAPSPAAKVEQKVGLTDVSIEYSRPNMRGRTIFGGLVPYGKIWRTGANARTKITFSDDVVVGETTLKAGSYAIFTIPQADTWEVIFYTDHAGGGAPAELDETKVAARVTAQVDPVEMNIETFTISFDDLTSSSAVIGFLWEKSYVGVTFKVPTDASVMASIDKAMAGPGFGEYYAAATYYLAEGKDAAQAKKWIDKAMAMNKEPRFWQLRQQSLIYAAAGDKMGAIALAKKSLAAAEEAGNADYVKMNKDSLAEWAQ
ncbi:MAG: DUF2911 domain-containing protein [Bacteroidia bacterium]|nr:DUF2911 domain-containing protein [Bacteroidia bacterium]NND25497.1 DUF2911 domain-containing protein [Flavobacteriaceae bacterium]MBT8279689.1 DUF2911 domain-containing protein [Bacteroidia bacterium]NNK60988.1 DUF2911 domain-containing protein [Flavobacteriaceae bacterium]NNL32545.1 DUF2911 domain-containing protein [Flavobacteriaceae bacterium]